MVIFPKSGCQDVSKWEENMLYQKEREEVTIVMRKQIERKWGTEDTETKGREFKQQPYLAYRNKNQGTLNPEEGSEEVHVEFMI